jgi:GNAT superfamily N-acetyltransferase
VPYEIRPVALDHPDARKLIDRVQEFYAEIYGDADSDPMDPAEFAPPVGAFYVGYLDGVPVATGAWRRVDVPRLGVTSTAEIKRMYVADEARGHGLARGMLAHLEDAARAAGFGALLLSTGLLQPEAIALYTSSGYQPVEAFGHYAGSELNRCFGTLLTPK